MEIHKDYLGNEFKPHHIVVKVSVKPRFVFAGLIIDGRLYKSEEKDNSKYWEVLYEFTYDEFIKNPFIQIDLGDGKTLITRKFDPFDDLDLVSNQNIIYCIKGLSDDPELFYFDYKKALK